MKNKLFSLLNLRVTELIAFLLAFVAILPANHLGNQIYQYSTQKNQYEREVSTFDKTDYNLYVIEPGQNQKEELLGFPGVTDVFMFYRYTASISFGSTTKQTNAVFTNDLENIELSQFVPERSLGSLNTQPNNAIKVDMELANQLGVTLNDSVSVSFIFGGNLTFVVSEIYMQDIFYANNVGVAYLSFTSALETLLEDTLGEAKKYSGAYLKSSTIAATKTALEQSYKPLGQLLPRGNFPTQSAYDNYVEGFMSQLFPLASYTKQALAEARGSSTNFNLEQFTQTTLNSLTIDSILYFVSISIVIATIIFFLKKIFNFNDTSALYFFQRQYLKFMVGFLFIYLIATGLFGFQTLYQNYGSFTDALFLFPIIVTIPYLVGFLLFAYYKLKSALNKRTNKNTISTADQILELDKTAPTQFHPLDEILSWSPLKVDSYQVLVKNMVSGATNRVPLIVSSPNISLAEYPLGYYQVTIQSLSTITNTVGLTTPPIYLIKGSEISFNNDQLSWPGFAGFQYELTINETVIPLATNTYNLDNSNQLKSGKNTIRVSYIALDPTQMLLYGQSKVFIIHHPMK